MPEPAPRDPERNDVDARFLLANDRTLLAWVRTSLTLVAVGVGLLQLGRGARHLLPATGLLVLGSAAATAGLLRYRAADRALRSGRLPPSGIGPSALAGVVAALSVVLVVLALTGNLRR